MKRLALCSLSALLLLAGEPAVGSPAQAPPSRTAAPTPLLVAPLGLIASIGSGANGCPTPLDNGARLLERDGWRDLVMNVNDHGWGVMIEVRGEAAFERSTILLADGTRLDLDLGGARRSDGLYALADFLADREVIAVGLRARARGSRAFVGVRLVRPAESDDARALLEMEK